MVVRDAIAVLHPHMFARAHAFRAKDVNENDDWLSLQAGHAPLYNNPCSSLVTPDLVSPCEAMGVL